MFCKHCGTQIEDSAKFCPTCGKIVEREEYVAAEAPAPNYFENPTPDYFETPAPAYFENSRPAEKESGGGILGCAIVGLAFACTWILSFLGIIFSCIAKAKINSYVMRNGELDAPGKVGKGISTAGVIVSIIMTVLLVLYIVALASLL